MRVLFAILLLAFSAAAQTERLQQQFATPPDDARIMMRWWWFGPAVTDQELERELRAMKQGGIGGAEIQPVYPVALNDAEMGVKNLPYLSDQFLERIRFVSAKAKELGMRLDITLGSGWPYGGPHVSVDQASSRLRIDRVPIPESGATIALPDLGNGEHLLAMFVAKGDRKSYTSEGLRRLPDSEIQGKRVRVPAGLKDHVAIFFIAGRTGQQVKRPSVNAEGFVLDHYSRAAVQNHLSTVADRLRTGFGTNPPYAVFSDSLEVYQADWTPDLLKQFQARRGYDLTPYLPALAADTGPQTAAVRHDWGKTLTELAEDEYLKPLTEWAHKNGSKFRSQTYGIPPVRLSSNALVDLPEGEGYQWRKFNTSRWAASASHLYGRPVTSSETWTWLHSPVFAATPLDMKSEADMHFLMGINQLIGHGWPYSPPSVGEPGWRFYAAAVFNDHNPWYMVMPDLAKYLQRVSYLLRQGKPANDVALYLPTDDAWAGFTAGRNLSINVAMETLLGENTIAGILDAGFNFDVIDDGAIEARGIDYPLLVLPNVDRMPLATVKKLQAYIAKGGKVVALGRTPTLAPGLKEAGDAAQIAAFGKSLTRLEGRSLAEVSTPDMSLTPKVPEVGFIHRSVDGADVYFVANTSNRRQKVNAAFRVTGKSPEVWDPYSGEAAGLAVISSDAKTTTVALDLAPYDSRVVVFGNRKLTPPPAHVSGAPIDISTGWQVSFPGGSKTMQNLKSWTDDESTKYYSGTAVYSRTVSIPADFMRSGTVKLDFGQGTPVEPQPRGRLRAWIDSPVREAATVTVNGKPAGSLWHPPYSLEIGSLVHAGANQISVTVGNLAVNTMVGQAPVDYKLLNMRYGERFTPQDVEGMQPLSSGLLGPIRLIP